MSVTAILSFATSSPTESIISQLSQVLDSLPEKPHFVIGTKVQDPSTVQITSSWPSLQDPTALSSTPSFRTLSEAISTIASSPVKAIIALLDKAVFAHGTAPLIEYVYSSFPASSTPEFRAKIEGDFSRFEGIYRQRGAPQEVGEVGLATGWAEANGGMTGFVVVRGWTGMEAFQASVQTEVFKSAIGILLGWKAPFELWHVERRAGDEGL